MRKFYGLRLISTVYKLLSVLTALMSIILTGFLWGDAYLTTRTIQVSINGDWSWALQSFVTLFVGGLIALTFYVLSQMIDLAIDGYQSLARLELQIEKNNESNYAVLELQKRLMKYLSKQGEKEIDDVTKQIQSRKMNIQIQDQSK